MKLLTPLLVAAAATALAPLFVSSSAGAAEHVAAAPSAAGATSELDANQIVDKNVAARGGLEAWRRIDTMVWVGHLQSVSAMDAGVHFVMKMKRPNQMRFEVSSETEKSVRVFDGNDGWKAQPPRSNKPPLMAYTPDEVRFARDAPGLDGWLIDHEAKGVGVALDGIDEVDGHKAYRLAISLPSGTVRHDWVDAKTFLELKYDREVRVAGGKPARLEVFYRNYQMVDRLMIPMSIETGSAPGRAVDTMVIDRVLLNTPLEPATFARPAALGRTVAADPASKALSLHNNLPSSRQRLPAPGRTGATPTVDSATPQ